MISAVMPTYARADLAFVRGEGPYLFDTEGQKYLDFASGIAVTTLGHNHPRLTAALQAASEGVWHTSNLVHIPTQEALADALVAHTFADTVFFGNSGAEAVECCIKVARKFHAANGHPERFRVITFESAFHGRTLATLAAGNQAKHLDGFGPKVDGFDQVPFGDIAALEAAIGPATAAIMVEPIQGESGIRVPSDSFLPALREIADREGILLIFDEVQSGVGRTGRLFAHEHWGVTPDVMAVAKALGGGLPIGACLATERAAQGMVAGTHGSTFGGNPLSTAVAFAVMEEVTKPGFLESVEKNGALLRDGLEKLKAKHGNKIAEVRGKGLFLGLRCTGDPGVVIEELRKRGMLTVIAGDNVVRLLPPLIVTEEHIAEALAKLDEALSATSF
ncbi:MAG: aspartate aminotransferase family protein [Alphaproteobacteria bacterium]